MKMLVPVDGSLASFNAAKKAVEIAKEYGFSIKLITVIDHNDIVVQGRNERLWHQASGSLTAGRAMIYGDDSYTEALRDNAEDLLESLFNELNLSDVKGETEVLIGEPYHVILEKAKDEKADLIVMGNRGFSRIKRFFVGSVAQRVISEAPCPVLVIHTDSKD